MKLVNIELDFFNVWIKIGQVYSDIHDNWSGIYYDNECKNLNGNGSDLIFIYLVVPYTEIGASLSTLAFLV